MEKTIFDTSGQSVQKSQEGLFLQDGIAGLRALPRHSVDMLLTDPPYGTTRNFWDVPLSLPELWEAVKWAVKPEGAVLFFAQCPYDKVLGASNLPTPMGRAMLNICIVFAQLERESIQMRVQDAFYSRCTKGYYMRGRTPYGFDTEPIVMDGIKTKKLVENAEMDFAELMFQMYAEPGNSYGDITRYFVKHSIKVYDKALQRAFISKLLRNPVYVQADMDIYEYFKAQGVKIESTPEMFTGDNSCYLYQGREGEEQILVIAPHQGRITSQLWLTVQRKLSQNTSFQNGRKCHNTWLAGKIKCGRCGYALTALRAQNGVTYLRCKQRADNGSCEGAGTLTAQSMESFVYGEMVEKMRKYHTLKGGKEQGYNPKLTAARVALAKTESEIEKLLDTLSGANPLLLQYANNRIEELDTERQKQLKLVADLTANSVSDTQIDCITNYLNDWESVSFDDIHYISNISFGRSSGSVSPSSLIIFILLKACSIF